MKKILLMVLALGGLSQISLGTIEFLLDAPQDDFKARQEVQNHIGTRTLTEDYNSLIRTRILTLNASEISRIFGPPIATKGTLFDHDTNPHSAPHPTDLVLSLFAPACSAVSGLHNSVPASNHDHIDLHAIGDLGYVEIYYGTDGTSTQQAVLYFRTDKDFVPLQTTNDFARRLAWDRGRFAAVKNWLDQRLPQTIDLGAIDVPEVSPLPEPKLGPGEAHQFKYGKIVPVWVQGGGMAFNISGRAEPYPEAKFTNHCVEVRMAGPSAVAPQPKGRPVCSRVVTPGEAVAFRMGEECFIFRANFVNIGFHPLGDFGQPERLLR